MADGRLYVVATPIGNLEDITLRALRILNEADLIAAEDTRHARRLLTRHNISTPLVSCHEHNEAARARDLVRQMAEGKRVALISDAGTPLISDPGYRLVQAARSEGIPVEAVPGPSAVVAALSVSGLPAERFTFAGFFPRKRGAALHLIERAAAGPAQTLIFFEAPGRLRKTLRLLAEFQPNAQVCVARELTKLHEEVRTGAPGEVAAHYEANPPKGECVVLVQLRAAGSVQPPGGEDTERAGSRGRDLPATLPGETEGDIRLRVAELMKEEGLSQRDAVRRVAEALNLPRKMVYYISVQRAP